MTSRPAAPDRPVGWTDVEEAMITNPKPESETPETDAFKERLWDALADSPKSRESNWEYLARSLERRLSLAQTEIKGHKLQTTRLGKDLACAQENFHVTNQAYVKADAELTQAQARIAELEKLLQRVRPFIDGRFDNNFLAQDEVRPDIVKAIDAALKDRA